MKGKKRNSFRSAGFRGYAKGIERNTRIKPGMDLRKNRWVR